MTFYGQRRERQVASRANSISIEGDTSIGNGMTRCQETRRTKQHEPLEETEKGGERHLALRQLTTAPHYTTPHTGVTVSQDTITVPPSIATRTEPSLLAVSATATRGEKVSSSPQGRN